MSEADWANLANAELQNGVPIQREFHGADNWTKLSDVGTAFGYGCLHIGVGVELQVTGALGEGRHLDTRVYTVTAWRKTHVRTIDRDPIRCFLRDHDVPVFLTYRRFICRECDRRELALRRVNRDEWRDVILYRRMMVDPAATACSLL